MKLSGDHYQIQYIVAEKLSFGNPRVIVKALQKQDFTAVREMR